MSGTLTTTAVSSPLQTAIMSSTSPTPILLSSPLPKNRTIKKRSKELLLERRAEVLVIKINRPQAKNALNRNAVYELIAAVGGATYNKDIKVVVLTGVGDIFTGGNDLKQIKQYQRPEDYYRSENYVLRSLIKAFIVCPKILICLVNGPCIGIGFTLSALCDAVYCTKNAYFQTPLTELGICPEACSSWTFPLQFGQSWSTNLLIFGEKLTAQKAEQLGFVLQIFDNDLEIEKHFWYKISEYAKLPWNSVRISKRLIRMHCRENLLLALGVELKEIEKLRKSPVHQQAFEKCTQKSKGVEKSKL